MEALAKGQNPDMPRPKIVTAGGRVLCAVGLGDTVAQAQAQAYELVRAVHWNLVQYRRDIGYRAMAREDAASE